MIYNKLSNFCFAFLILLLLSIVTENTTASTSFETKKIKYAGVRSSSYGIRPFLAPKEWKNALDTMTGYFKDAQPTVIWIIGVVNSETKGAILEFPSADKTYDKITFSNFDKHESYLNYFDQQGVKVFLQVEPGYAEVKTLIDLVLNRYGKHPCIAGFGIDVEWYRNDKYGQSGTSITDIEAETWEAQIKSYNKSYRLFLKHYDKSYLCPNYRGDIVFIDDSQQFANAKQFVNEMIDFADYFYPNLVMYQIGYKSDRNWWKRYNYPAKRLGDELLHRTKQDCGIIWVDFTLRELIDSKEI